MKDTVLTLRLSRRAVGAAVLQDDELSFADGRHLTSSRDRAVAAVARYVRRVFDLTAPAEVVIDAPANPVSTTGALLETVFATARAAGVQARRIELHDVLHAYGVPAISSRIALRSIVATLWPQLGAMTGRVKPYVMDAAAVTLYAQVERALNPKPT